MIRMSPDEPPADPFRNIRRILGPDFMRHYTEGMRVLRAQSMISSSLMKGMEPLLARNSEVLRNLTAPITTNAMNLLTAQNKDLLRSVEAASHSLGRLPLITDQVKFALEGFRDAWLGTLPPNWEGRALEDVRSLLDFMEETGWCLVWTPRPEVIDALLSADPTARADVLLEHQAAILDDLEACLAGVDRVEVEELREAAGDALLAYRNRTPFSSQAAATTILTTAIHVHLGIPTFRKARESFGAKTPMDVGIRQFRIVAILRVAYQAIAEFRGKPGERLPVTFNRHASVHRVSRDQFNRTNALVALMLVVPLVRELDHLFAQQADEEEDENAA